LVSEVDEAHRRVRQLLLSGDNTLKNREGTASMERARARFEEAATVAREAGLGASMLAIIDARLRQLDALAHRGSAGAA
jgi:hypothetical protein